MSIWRAGLLAIAVAGLGWYAAIAASPRRIDAVDAADRSSGSIPESQRDEEVTRLLLRVQQLEAAMLALQAKGTPPKEVVQEADDGRALSARPSMSEAEYEDSIQAEYDQRIHGQPDDHAWEGTLHAAAAGALGDPALAGSKLEYVECSALACRLQIQHEQPEAREALPLALTQALGRGHDLWGRELETEGRMRSTVYVTRKRVEVIDDRNATVPLGVSQPKLEE